jgi:hypothetical protein
MEKTRVFIDGDSQSVQIPAKYRFNVDEDFICRDPLTGDRGLPDLLYQLDC